MIRAEKIKRDQLEQKIQKLKFTHTQAAKVEQKEVEKEVKDLIQKRYGETLPGVTFITFMEYTKIFNGKTDEVKKNII